MLARNAVVLGLGALFSLAVGCGAPADGTSKNGQPVGGSPNDPGWVPPGANPGQGPDDTTTQPGDDQGEQPGTPGNPNGCQVRDVPMPIGWTVHSTSTFSYATPAAWFDYGSTDTTLHFIEGTKKGSNGAVGSMTTYATLDEDVAAHEAELSMHGQRACSFTVTDKTYRCDAAKVLHAVCASNFTVDVTVMAVMHEGTVFDLDCGGEGDTSLCPTMLDTLRFAK